MASIEVDGGEAGLRKGRSLNRREFLAGMAALGMGSSRIGLGPVIKLDICRESGVS
jgi:hypothetical protein